MEKRGRFPPSLHEYIVSWSHWEDRKRHRVIRWNKRSYMCRTCLRNIMFLSFPQYHSDPVTVVCTSTGSPLTGSANSWFCSYACIYTCKHMKETMFLSITFFVLLYSHYQREEDDSKPVKHWTELCFTSLMSRAMVPLLSLSRVLKAPAEHTHIIHTSLTQCTKQVSTDYCVADNLS